MRKGLEINCLGSSLNNLEMSTKQVINIGSHSGISGGFCLYLENEGISTPLKAHPQQNEQTIDAVAI